MHIHKIGIFPALWNFTVKYVQQIAKATKGRAGDRHGNTHESRHAAWLALISRHWVVLQMVELEDCGCGNA